MISVIVITYNESAYIDSIIHQINDQVYHDKFEIIVSDGGSEDNTLEIAKKRKVLIVNSSKGKAWQLNAGAQIAKGDVLFFVHADMKFNPGTLSAIHNVIIKEGFDGGGFANIFDRHNEKIKRLGTWLNLRFLGNREQSDKGIFYGDNGLFVKKSVFKSLKGFSEIPIMEDYDFSFRMKQNFKIKKIYDPQIIVSARRHEKAGFIKTRLQWIFIRIFYKLGVSPWILTNFYKDIR